MKMSIGSTQALIAVGAALALVGVIRKRSLYLRIRGLRGSVDSETFRAINDAMHVVETAFSKYKDSQLALAFNGGKDCLIVFQLVKAYCQRFGRPIPYLVYFEREDEFEEMIEFMYETVAANHLSIHTLRGGFKAGLEELRSQGIHAVFMGQRRTDPYAPSDHFAMTTQGWPEMMRINPILDLNYTGVWAFLRGTATKYCLLYDQGYTSLGPKSKTLPNAKLSSDSLGGHHHPRPAHELVVACGEDERSGRI